MCSENDNQKNVCVKDINQTFSELKLTIEDKLILTIIGLIIIYVFLHLLF